jgi:hypothetical protein
VHGLAVLALDFQPVGEPAAFVRREPGGIRRAVGQIEEDHDRKDDRGHGLDDEQPLPAGQSEAAMQIQ